MTKFLPNAPAPDPGETADLNLNLVRRLVALRHAASVGIIEGHVAENPNHRTRLSLALDSYATKTAARQWVVDHYGPQMEIQERPRDPRDNVHIYAKSAAASIELGNRDGTPSIVVDAALSTTGAAPRTYDWKSKIALTLSFAEASELLLVMLGKIPQAQMRYHGTGRDKSMEVTLQGPNVVIKLTAAAVAPRVVPVTPRDRLASADLLLRYLNRLEPYRSQSEWLSLLSACLVQTHAESKAP